MLPDILAAVVAPTDVRVEPDITALVVGAAPGDDSTLPDILAAVVGCRSTDPLSLAAVAIS